jgi:hypothetical protein
LGKGYTSNETLIKTATIVKGSRLPVIWWSSFGLPGESDESIKETFAFVQEHVRKTDLVLATIGLKILPGTKLEKIARQEGQISPDNDLMEAKFYEPPAISLKEIHQKVMEAALRMPNIITCTETRSFHIPSKIGIFVKRLTKHRMPIWSVVPTVNRIRNRTTNRYRAAS